MSQHWHGHWTEDSFKPNRLMNWEVPKWYPSWPDRHCTTTKVEANDRGYILNTKNKSKNLPWGNFKGTWDLPKKINKSTALQLSAIPESKRKEWELHVMKNLRICEKSKKPSKIRKRGGGGEDKRKDVAESTNITQCKEVESESSVLNKESAPEGVTLDEQISDSAQEIEKIKLQENTVPFEAESLGDIAVNKDMLQAPATENMETKLKENVIDT